MPPPAISLLGVSGSGKTTLLERLLKELERRGVRTACAKHTHHERLDDERPGKDTSRLKAAGARAVRGFAGADPAPFEEWVASLGDVDLVLVEGFRALRLPFVEVVGEDGARHDDRAFGPRIAVAEAHPGTGGSSVFARDDAEGLADRLVRHLDARRAVDAVSRSPYPDPSATPPGVRVPRSDFRSDTVTTPTDAMREAMATAEVGDDVLGEDETVQRLEAAVASLLGKEAGLFVPSGTMANQIGVKLYTQPGDEIIAEASSHVLTYEAGGIGLISGVQCRPIRGDFGVMDPAEVEAAVRGEDIHLPRTSLLCLENTNNVAGGTVVPLENFDALRAVADRHGLKILLDGARLLHAALAEGVAPSAFAARADLAWIALSKGLSAPVGSVLCGTRADVVKARRIRKVLGGGMRQVGVLAAAGLVALETGVERLVEDHRRARRLAEAAAELEGVTVDLERTRTNIVLLRFSRPVAREVAARLAEHDVLAMPMANDRLRFCTHRLVGDDDVERAVAHLRRIVT